METDAVQLLQGVPFIMSEVGKPSFYRIVRVLMIKYIRKILNRNCEGTEPMSFS